MSINNYYHTQELKNPLSAIFSPQTYKQGWSHITLSCSDLNNKETSLLLKIKHIALGILLLLPLINGIGLFILQHLYPLAPMPKKNLVESSTLDLSPIAHWQHPENRSNSPSAREMTGFATPPNQELASPTSFISASSVSSFSSISSLSLSPRSPTPLQTSNFAVRSTHNQPDSFSSRSRSSSSEELSLSPRSPLLEAPNYGVAPINGQPDALSSRSRSSAPEELSLSPRSPLLEAPNYGIAPMNGQPDVLSSESRSNAPEELSLSPRSPLLEAPNYGVAPINGQPDALSSRSRSSAPEELSLSSSSPVQRDTPDFGVAPINGQPDALSSESRSSAPEEFSLSPRSPLQCDMPSYFDVAPTNGQSDAPPSSGSSGAASLSPRTSAENVPDSPAPVTDPSPTPSVSNYLRFLPSAESLTTMANKTVKRCTGIDPTGVKEAVRSTVVAARFAKENPRLAVASALNAAGAGLLAIQGYVLGGSGMSEVNKANNDSNF